MRLFTITLHVDRAKFLRRIEPPSSFFLMVSFQTLTSFFRRFWNRAAGIVRTKPVLSGAALVAVIVIAAAIAFSVIGNGGLETAVAAARDLEETVEISGSARSASSVDLSFEQGGTVAYIAASVGERVGAGAVVASLSNGELRADVLRAEADLDLEQATLDAYRRGTRSEEIAVEEAKYARAESAAAYAHEALADAVRSGYTAADNAVRGNTDQLFDNPRGASPHLKIAQGSPARESVTSQRVVAEQTLLTWQAGLGSAPSLADAAVVAAARSWLADIASFLDAISLLVNAEQPSTNITQTTIDGWKTDIAAARTAVNGARDTLRASENTLAAARADIAVGEQNLLLLRSGKTDEEIREQEARVRRAEANLVNARARLGKTLIVAPFGGIVTRQDARVGEVVAANVSLTSLSGAAGINIEARIPEVSIGLLAVGNAATAEFDAYPRESFMGTVVAVDRDATDVDGVPTYKTVIRLADNDPRIAEGMTATVRITTRVAKNVLAIPIGAVGYASGAATVRIVSGENVTERPVAIGIRGDDGFVEIRSGLSAGEAVIVSEE